MATDGTTASGRLSPADVMALAVELAGRGPSFGPNPQVGCVLLDAAGEVIGRGWHRGAGTPHAEVAAISDAVAHGHRTAGATAVVTLEPCNHHGRTGPCSHALLAAGITRVEYAVADPGAASAGGAAWLRANGVSVTKGLGASMVERQLEVWLTAMRRRSPWIILKLATSLDARVAAADGSSRWITSPQSREHAHRLRAEVDAIVVGTGTVADDDPSLTARTPDGQLAEHQPLRVVVGQRPVPADARLRGAGGQLLHLPTHDVAEVVATLWQHEVRRAIVEGGPTLASAFLRAGLVDEIHAYVAPLLLGGPRTATGDLGVTSVTEAITFTTTGVNTIGPDVLITSRRATSADASPEPHTPPVPTVQET